MANGEHKDFKELSLEELAESLPGLEKQKEQLVREKQEVDAQIATIMEQLRSPQTRAGEISRGIWEIEKQMRKMTDRIATIEETTQRRVIFSQALQEFQQSGIVTLVERKATEIPDAEVRVYQQFVEREEWKLQYLQYPSVSLTGSYQPGSQLDKKLSADQAQTASKISIWSNELGRFHVRWSVHELYFFQEGGMRRIGGSAYQSMWVKSFDPSEADQLLETILRESRIKNT